MSQVIEHYLPADAGHRVLIAGYISAQGVSGPQKLIDEHVNQLGRRVLSHVDFFDNNPALTLVVLGVEPGMKQYIAQHVQG